MRDTHLKIAAVRKLRRLSQQDAAENTRFSLRTYQRIESGKTDPPLTYIQRIAEGFGCSVDDILHFDLENNRFPAQAEQKIQNLEAENGQLRQMIDGLLNKFFPRRPGGGGR